MSGVRGLEEEEVVMGSLSQAWYIYIRVRLGSMEYICCMYNIVARMRCTERESTVRGNYSTGGTRRK